MSPAGPLAAPQQQHIKQSHLTNGRQMLIALPQQNGSPPLATWVVSSISRPGGLPKPLLKPHTGDAGFCCPIGPSVIKIPP